MIKLSDVKVRLQYRWRVRQRLMVLQFARLHGPTAAGLRFGVSVRTIRRWRVRWRQDALEGLVPRYPRRRGRRIAQRVLRLYRRLHQTSSLAFLSELCRAFPFRIRKLQCDNGHEFPFAFALAVQALGIRHRYIKPRRPQQNGKVERSHRIDQEEFWGRQRFEDFEAAAAGLRGWETHYNHERFSMALQGRTPVEKLAALTAASAAV